MHSFEIYIRCPRLTWLIPVICLQFMFTALQNDSLIAGESLVFIGTYTDAGSGGIYACRFDPATGEVTRPWLAAETENPSFLAVSADNRYVYTVNELNSYKGEQTGAVSVFNMEPGSGILSPVQQVSSLGAAPAHLSLDRSGRFLLVANYNGGSVAVFPIEPDGQLGAYSAFQKYEGHGTDPERQEAPHAHYIEADGSNRHVLAADLGTDRVMIYRFDASVGALTPEDPPFVSLNPGSGPRHLVFSPGDRFVYVINELSSNITVLRYMEQSGQLKAEQTISTLPENFTGTNTAAEILLNAAGTCLYASNRGDDSIISFRVDSTDGRLTFNERVASGGNTPRHFTIDPTGNWLLAANQESDNIVIFRIDQETGRLIPTGQSLNVDCPVCVLFLESD